MPVNFYYPLSVSPMNPWEHGAFEYNYGQNSNVARSSQTNTAQKSLLYPGIYAPSGLDIMSILSRVAMRPSPVVQLGPVDASCAIVVCDIELPDCPVAYANEACAELTGYSQGEMLGRNCRFLQAPPGGQVVRGGASARRHGVEKAALSMMRRAVETNCELMVEVTNFKKNGQRFTNVLTMIPICWDTPAPKYYIGFLAEKMT
ncbi:PAS domain-containing protein [Nemania sp. NC0429]|nr:PAS domain-containing protein [Nemania sp. NC0429]